MKHRLIAEILQDNPQGTPYVFEERIQQNSPCPVNKYRNIIRCGFPFKEISVGFQFSRHYRNIPVAVILL